MTRMPVLEPTTPSRSPWWQYGLFFLGVVLALPVAVPLPPGHSMTNPIYIARLVVMGGMIVIAVMINLRLLVPLLLDQRRYVVYGVTALLLVGLSTIVVYEGNVAALRLWSQPAPAPALAGRVGPPAPPGPFSSGGPPPERPAFGEGPGMSRAAPGGASAGDPSGGTVPSPASDMLRRQRLMVFFLQIGAFVGLSSLLHFMKALARSHDIERQKLEAELTALKAQLNPHFLFNSLNNIYSLALDKSDLAPDYVLKLSELMRYILHDSQTPAVPLSKELEFVQHYLDLERIRMENTVRMDLAVEGNIDGIEVAPLLLLPFVENAFKHGVQSQPTGAFVQITVRVLADDVVNIEAVNSKEVDEVPILAMTVSGDLAPMPGGVGLENVRRRLELLYPQRHELNLHDSGTQYEVNLRITT